MEGTTNSNEDPTHHKNYELRGLPSHESQIESYQKAWAETRAELAKAREQLATKKKVLEETTNVLTWHMQELNKAENALVVAREDSARLDWLQSNGMIGSVIWRGIEGPGLASDGTKDAAPYSA